MLMQIIDLILDVDRSGRGQAVFIAVKVVVNIVTMFMAILDRSIQQSVAPASDKLKHLPEGVWIFLL